MAIHSIFSSLVNLNETFEGSADFSGESKNTYKFMKIGRHALKKTCSKTLCDKHFQKCNWQPKFPFGGEKFVHFSGNINWL